MYISTYNVVRVVVVAHEWIEGAELMPTNAQLFHGVLEKATNVRTHQWNSEHIVTEDGCTEMKIL